MESISSLLVIVVLVVLVVAGVALALRKRPIEKSPPILTADSIQPAGEAISLVEAKKVYREYLQSYSGLGREDIVEHVRMFSEEASERLQDLKNDARESAQGIKRGRKLITEIKEKLKSTPNDELLEALEDAEGELEFDQRRKKESLNEAATLRKDKRKFLVDYINAEFQRSN